MAKKSSNRPEPRQPTVSVSESIPLLKELITRGKALLSTRPIAEAKFVVWKNHVGEALMACLGEDSDDRHSFISAGVTTVFVSGWGGDSRDPDYYSREELAEKVAMLESIVEGLEFKAAKFVAPSAATASPAQTKAPSKNEVFVVHGHDDAAKSEVARLLEKVGLTPIILHEQANAGQTIIEKFEKHAALVGFAVVLLTPDDMGAPTSKPQPLSPRARQNVILELGYFIGKLSRNRVCALYSGVEIPSDLLGVVYVERDRAGAWRWALGNELKAAGYDVDLNKI